MTATKNGWTIEGTPEEILALINAGKAKPAEEKPKKKALDWDKAKSLKDAGWSYKAIAEELGTTYQTVYSHFNGQNCSKLQ